MKTLKVIAFAALFAVTSFAQKESLLIGPGDELKVEVFDTPEMSQAVRVTDAGEVPLLFLGNVKVAGLTPGEAGKTIADSLKSGKYMLNPQVTVTVESFGTQQVSVLGQVHTPGVYSITAPVSILNVLSNAGGITESADRHITIERRGKSTETVAFFLSNDSQSAVKNDVLVYPGDVVLVPKAGVVYVMGDVGRPGGFSISDNDSKMTVLQALSIAGAPNKTALVSKAKLIRKTPEGGTVDVPIQLTAMEHGKAPDILMQPNDVLFVPFSFMKNIAFNSSQIAAAATSGLLIYH